MASTYIKKSFGQQGTRTTMTWSFWIKRHGISSYQKIFDADYNNSTDYYSSIYFKNDDTLKMTSYDNGSSNIDWATTRLFRDVNAWYHIVITMDTTNGTAGDRFRVYVNGERETLTGTYQVSQGTDNTMFNKTDEMFIGSKSTSVSDYLDASLSHFYFIDGTSYNASTFGSTDSTTGEWKINTSPSVTMGTNGFLIFKDGNTITDQSTNSNDWVLGSGTLTKTEDCPSNVFATFNPLVPTNTFSGNFTNGNTTITGKSDGKGVMLSTLGASTGKYYFEAKVTNSSGTSIGVSNDEISLNSWSPSTGNYVLYSYNGNVYRSSSTAVSSTTYTTNDIIGVAWNATDSEVTFYKNGTAINSGTAYSVEGTQGTMFIAVADTSTSGTPTVNVNFGNGYFGSTQISSAGTNASGNGIFEYDVPTGFTALSTKGLNL